MTARMHLALDRAFDRHPEPVADWVDAAEAAIAGADPALARGPGDGRSDQGTAGRGRCGCPSSAPTGTSIWAVRPAPIRGGWSATASRAACSPAGPGPSRRSPLADVADLLWSLHQASLEAALERDPAGRLDLAPLGQAWETRNRRAVLNGYLNTPGHHRADRARPRRGPQSGGRSSSWSGRLRRRRRVSGSGRRHLEGVAASSGETTLMATPVPSSKPAVVVALGQMWACQW